MFVGNDQILIHQGFVNTLSIGVGHQCIVGEGEESLYWIGITRGHGLKHGHWIGHVAAHNQICPTVTPNFFCCITQSFHTSIGEDWELVSP